MRVLLGLVVAASLLLAACGGDDGGEGASGGDVQAFCDLMEESEASDEELDPSTPEGQAQLEEILDAAPSEIKEDLEVLFGVVEQFEDMDEDDPEAFGAAFELMFNPEFIAAAENLDAFAVEECGLEPSDSAGDDVFGDDAVGDDLFSDDGFDLGDETGDGGFSAGDIRDHVEANAPDLADSLDSVLMVGDSDVSLNGAFDVEEAIETCELVGLFAGEQGVVVIVEVGDSDENILASGPDSGGICEAA